RNEDRGHQQQAGRTEQRERRRQGEPVDVRCGEPCDHGNPLTIVAVAWFAPKAWPETRFGQAESPTRQRSSGTTTASSPRRRSSAASGTAGPTSSCRTPEIARSMYIAASTIAIAPTTAQPQPCRNAPARIRNS